MSIARSLIVHNGHAFSLADCPLLPIEQFRQEVIEALLPGGGSRRFLPIPERRGHCGCWRRWPGPAKATWRSSRPMPVRNMRRSRPIARKPTSLNAKSSNSWNIRPLGHPWLKPVRFPRLLSPPGEG